MNFSAEKTENEIRNYGFNESLIEIKPEDYILGSTKLPNIVHRLEGQWNTPIYEPQADKYETWGCTVWGMENQAEIYSMEVFGFEPNYDERFIYLLSDIQEGGANPQNAYEAARANGLIDNELLPDTFAEFKDKSYLTDERKDKGQEWRQKKYEFLHDYLISPTKETIKENLKFSPIAISVTAWMQDDKGLYIDNGQLNTHWCVVYGYFEDERGIILKVFDSYDHSHKLLHPDHQLSVAKR